MSSLWSAFVSNSFFQKLAFTSRASVTLALKESFLEICRLLEIRTLIEAGAHEASASIEFMQLGIPHAIAIAIEPNPYTYHQKTIQAELFGVKTLNIGVGQRPCELELIIPLNLNSGDKSPLSASFLEKRENTEQVEKVLVNIQTLDAVSRRENLSPPIALWIDVEGFSEEVLSGAAKILNTNFVKLIYIELEDKELWFRQTLDQGILTILRNNGFELLIRDFEGRGQYNAIFCKKEDTPIVLKIKKKYIRKTTFSILWGFQKFPFFAISRLIITLSQKRRRAN
jgi:FkbM family methyltransferase